MTHSFRFLVGAVTAGIVVAGADNGQSVVAQAHVVNVAGVEELYAAVNDPENAHALVVVAPGTYALAALDTSGVARPNGGRLELQEGMGLQGVVGDRSAVVIDAAGLPLTSYVTQASPGLPPAPTGPIRMGRGRNSIEWLTIRNAARQGGIETDLFGAGPARIRIAHIASTGNVRGIEVRNFGSWTAGRVIDADLVDNHIYGNTTGLGEGIRIVNIQGANGAQIFARLSGNLVHGNKIGMLVVNNGSNLAQISVLSTGDRFLQNGGGTIIIGGLGSNTMANGNGIAFEARGSHFSDNNAFADIDRGGLVVIGGENISMPNHASYNTVNVVLDGCRLEGNQLMDIGAFGARSNPSSIGMPGTDNRVEVTLRGGGKELPTIVEIADSIPNDPLWMNTAVVIDDRRGSQ